MSSSARPRPPSWLQWLARLSAPRIDREHILGDLEEEFRRLHQVGGLAGARRWYRRQVFASLLPNLVRASESAPSEAHRRPQTRKGDSTMGTFLADLRSAWRVVRTAPGFTLVAVFTIALGIGSNTAIFSVLQAVVLRPLPFPQPQELVLLHNYQLDQGTDRNQVSFPDYRDLAERSRSFDGLGAWEPVRPSMTGADVEPRRLTANSVTASLFETLGFEMALGRGFTEQEDQPGAEGVAVLSHRFWQDQYAGSDSILGDTIRLNGSPYTIIGVLPPALTAAGGGGVLPSSSAALWLPWQVGPSAEVSELRGVHRARVIGRLAEGFTLAEASAEVSRIAAELAREYPQSNSRQGVWIEPARSSMVRHVRSTLYLLFGAVGLVLLLVCSNVSGLLLGRAVAREGEMALRMALGAGRWRLMRQLLTESLLLSVLGGATGVLLAWGLLRAALRFAPGSIPRLQSAGLEPRVLLYSICVVLLSSLLFGIAPAWRAGRHDLAAGARAGGLGGRSSLRQTLVVAQVAIAVVLMTGAGLLARSFWSVLAVDPGFRAEKLLGVSMEMPLPYVSPQWPRAVAFYQQVAEQTAALPGVQSTAAAYRHPLDAGWGTTFTFSARPEPAAGEEPQARFRPVTPRYFETVGILLLEGRVIDSRDQATAPGAVVVNESFVRTYFEPGQRVLGSGIDYRHWWGAGPNDYQIVGVVEDVRFGGLADSEARPALYFAHAQQPIVEMNLLVRHAGDSSALVPAIREAIWRIDPEMPLDDTFEMSVLLERTVAERRFTMLLLTAFAVISVVLCSLGVYGVLAFGVQRRRREIGVRMALGASLASVVGRVMRQGIRLVLIGCVIGLLGALALSGLIRNQLYGISQTDPMTLLGVPVALAVVALLAGWLPARRAARIDPAVTLRRE